MANGFFYDVKALVDKQSFANAKNELEKLSQTSAIMIKGIAGLSAALIGTAAVAGKVAQAESRVANAVGSSTSAVASWKIAAGMAGASADGLVSSLAAVEDKMQHLKSGVVDMNLAKNLGRLGIGYTQFAGMDSETRMRTVFAQAGKMTDQKQAAMLIGDVLGQAGKDYYQSLQLSGKSLDQQLKEARALNFVSDKNRKDAAVFASEVDGIKAAGKSILQMIGGELAAQLTPIARKIRSYLMTHRNEIQRGISGVVETAGKVFNAVAGFIEKLAPVVTRLIDNFGGLDQIILKVGIGFGLLKLGQIAGGLIMVIKNVNLLKAAFSGLTKGLLMGALYLLADDLAHYFTGKGKTVTGYIMENLDKIKSTIAEKFKNLIGEDNFNAILNGLEKTKEAIENLKKALPSLGDVWGKVFKDAIGGTVKIIGNLIQWFSNLIQWFKDAKNAFDEGGIGGVISMMWNDHKENTAEWKSRMKAEQERIARQKHPHIAFEALDKNERTAIMVQAKKNLKEQDFSRSSIGILVNGFKELGSAIGQTWEITTGKKLPQKEKKSKGTTTEKADKAVMKSDGFEYDDGSGYEMIDDGIVSPTGRVIGISPDDWVFALKDVGNLASAFMPSGVGATSQVNAPANYVINQTFNVTGVRAENFRESAYRGASEAMRETLNNASRIRQFMPGTR